MKSQGNHPRYLVTVHTIDILIASLGFRFTPSLASIIYHGGKAARAEIRRKFMPTNVGPDFPIVVTSYEMAMFDAKFLAAYKWKYVVVDEVMGKHIL